MSKWDVVLGVEKQRIYLVSCDYLPLQDLHLSVDRLLVFQRFKFFEILLTTENAHIPSKVGTTCLETWLVGAQQSLFVRTAGAR